MTKIEIKLGGGQNVDARSLVKRALREKKGRRGANKRTPKARGSLIECGMLTKPIILEVLKRHGVSIESIIMYERSGDRKRLSIPGVPIKGEVTSEFKTVTFSLSITSKRRKGVIFTEESEAQRREKQAEAKYLDNLNSLGNDLRAEAFYLTLGIVAEALSGEGSTLHPWHLVSFRKSEEPEESGGSCLRASLASLDSAAPNLKRAIWDVVHTHERGGDIGRTFDDFETQILEVLCNEEALRRVRSLADSQLSTSTA